MCEKLIILDLDGPILEGKCRHYFCYKQIILEGGGNPIALDDYWEMKRKKISRKVLLEKSNYQLDYDIYLKKWLKNIEQNDYLVYDSLKPMIPETLSTWKMDYKIYLVTLRHNKKNLLNQLTSLGIIHYFEKIICCDYRIKNSKYEAIKNTAFNSAVVIGDSEEDQKTAELLDVPFLAVINGLRDKSFLKACEYFNEICDISNNTLEKYLK